MPTTHPELLYSEWRSSPSTDARELIALCGFARRSSLRTQSPAVFSFSGAGEERRFDYLTMTYVEIP
jgi:hypothetical protein